MSLHQELDAITVAELRERGSRKWTDPGATPLGAWVAEEDFGTAPAVTEAMADVARRGLYGYLPDWLACRMRTSFAGFASRRYGWELDPEQIQPAPDVMAVLEYACNHLLSPGTGVLVPTPAYMPFLDTPRRLGRDVVEVPHVRDRDGRLSLDLEAMDQAMAEGRIGLVVLCNPHNPTGRVLTRAELEALDAMMATHPDVRVFCDEIHAPVVLPGARHLPYASFSPAAARRSITATSTSKAFGLPGLKCAQAILTNPDDLAGWGAEGERLLRMAATPGVAAAIAAYDDGEAWLTDLLDYLAGERDLLLGLVAEHLPGVRIEYPEGSYIAWLDCSELQLGEAPAAFFLREAGVAVSDGAACGAGSEHHVRLVFATPRPVLTAMLQAMGAAVARHASTQRSARRH